MTHTPAEMRATADLLNRTCAGIGESATQDMKLRDQAASMLRQAADAMEAKLPCDVKLPPATTITKGCTVETLLLSIKQREGMTDVKFPRPAKPDSIGLRYISEMNDR